MSDRLEEARDMNVMNLTVKQAAIHEWLISELTKCRAENKQLEERINKWRASVENADVMGMGWKDRAEKAEAKLVQCREENAKVAEKLKEEIERLRSMPCDSKTGAKR